MAVVTAQMHLRPILDRMLALPVNGSNSRGSQFMAEKNLKKAKVKLRNLLGSIFRPNTPALSLKYLLLPHVLPERAKTKLGCPLIGKLGMYFLGATCLITGYHHITDNISLNN